ncbi:MAG: Rho termination factor N-terminal domain-containing protein [Bacilli bacterium]
MTVAELRQLGESKNIENVKNMKKAEIIEALK